MLKLQSAVVPMTHITLVTESFTVEEGQPVETLSATIGWLKTKVALRDDIEVIVVIAGHDAGMVQRLLHDAGCLDGELAQRFRCLHLPGARYDAAKHAAAVAARGDIVVYLDGDCVPEAGDWLERLIEPIERGHAEFVAGFTRYPPGFLRDICSLLDFGFLCDRSLGCYASNNVAFEHAALSRVPLRTDILRSNCYAHAQDLLRQGQRLAHAAEAACRHDLPPVFKERFRRGYDLAAACRANPALAETSWLRDRRLGGWHAVWNFWRSNVALDFRRLRESGQRFGLTGWRRATAYPAIVALRMIDVFGIRQAVTEFGIE